MLKYHIDVTQDDINKSIELLSGDTYAYYPRTKYCPIALAVKRVTGASEVGATHPVITISGLAEQATHDGTSGQDRESYSDTQDRENYTIEDILDKTGRLVSQCETPVEASRFMTRFDTATCGIRHNDPVDTANLPQPFAFDLECTEVKS